MTQNLVNTPPQVWSEGFRTFRVTGLFRVLLRDHFSNPDAITHEEFRNRVWKDGDSTGILIEDYTVWTPGRSGKSPSIIIKRNAIQSIKRGIGNMQGATDTGHRQYLKFWSGSHTLFCTGKEGAEAEILASETYRYLMHMGPVIRQTFNFLMLEVVSVGELSQIKEAYQHYTVPITIAYAMEEAWTVRQLNAPWLKTVQFKADGGPYCETQDPSMPPSTIPLQFG